MTGRELDWGDVERELIRRHDELNRSLIRTELGPLPEPRGAPDSLDKLQQVLATVRRRLSAKL